MAKTKPKGNPFATKGKPFPPKGKGKPMPKSKGC